ncbi:MAG TPA: DNA/RNA non-specific endonuclease [Flavobacterium sp.]|jgi:endonuclease G|uniref:DNA/RNA non-specific endonuclease n=1 Tax=Flavobacterium sp. TaxID=239 RepID=UPI001B4EA834|nr:DNA/RNA non-specific endonuclease [Flavobacterium sp.]MBP8888309.1 DNA/RNA non-specific endonuclease [Flavobacterium sp.]HRM45234.1 DNA/RNA non-specific endonuclease [Flavobacterium sp.]
MKNRKLFALLFSILNVILFSSCKKEAEIGNSVTYYQKSKRVSNENYVSNLSSRGTRLSKTFDYLPTSTTNQIVKHKYYTLSYNEAHEQAEWVAYELKKDYIKNNNLKRPFFIADDKVQTGSAHWRNYKNTIYDKGHLCPAGDMEFALDAYNETFLTSNIAPQVRKFNNGVWNRLEQKVRFWAVKYDGVYVVTGGVLEPTLTTIGSEKVSVPKFFYKILLDTSGANVKMIGFLLPNSESDKPLYSFVVSVDYIEKLTGIDFFSKLNDDIENQLEKSSDYKSWSFN